MKTDTPEFTPFLLDKMDKCRHLLPAPGDHVVGQLIEGVRKAQSERDAARARVAELEAECEQLKHERNRAGMDARKAMMDSIKAAQTQQPLERPDRPGWWWVWSKIGNRWEIEWVVDPAAFYKGQWLPATPPPVPEKEDA